MNSRPPGLYSKILSDNTTTMGWAVAQCRGPGFNPMLENKAVHSLL